MRPTVAGALPPSLEARPRGDPSEGRGDNELLPGNAFPFSCPFSLARSEAAEATAGAARREVASAAGGPVVFAAAAAAPPPRLPALLGGENFDVLSPPGCDCRGERTAPLGGGSCCCAGGGGGDDGETAGGTTAAAAMW